MKKVLIYLIMIMTCSIAFSCSAQTKMQTNYGEIIVDNNDTAFLNKLMSMDFDKYIGQETKIFLNVVDQGYIKRYFYEGRSGYASFLRMQYAKKIAVDVYVEKYQYMNPLDKEYKWDIEAFKKESLFKIKLRYNRKCIKGCDEDEVDR